MSQKTLPHVIGHLYAAVSDHQKWPSFLMASRQFFGADYANLLYLDHADPQYSFSLLSGFEHRRIEDQQEGARKQIELRDQDPRMVYCAQHPGKPVRCTEILPRQDFHATRVYRELLQPSGIEYSLLVQYADSEDKFTGISFHRGPQQAPFSKKDEQQLGALLPHLRQALTLQDRLARVDQQVHAPYQALDALAAAIALVDERGKLDFANQAAHRLSQQHDGLSIRDGQLFVPAAQQHELLAALAAAAQTGQHQALLLHRASGKDGFQCVVSAMPDATPARSGNLLVRHRFMVVLHDPEQTLETPKELLQRLFGITPAESWVLERLAAGHTPEDMASEGDLSISTIRTHLRSLFLKTGTTRQQELLQKVMAGPIGVVGR